MWARTNLVSCNALQIHASLGAVSPQFRQVEVDFRMRQAVRMRNAVRRHLITTLYDEKH